MPLKNITVKDCVLEVEKGSPETANFEITEEESTMVKCDGKAAYKTIKFKITDYAGQGIVASGEGKGEIKSSAIYVKIEGNPAILEGDKSDDVDITGPNPVGVSITVKDKIYVKDAGQMKCKGM